MKQRYPAEITGDEQGRYLVRFLDLAEAITDGESMEDALANAREALALTLEARRAEGLPIPKPQTASGENIHFIEPAPDGQKGFCDEFQFTWTPSYRRPLPKEALEKIAELVGKDQVAQVETLIAMSAGTDIKPMSPQKARSELKKLSEDLDKVILAYREVQSSLNQPGLFEWLYKVSIEREWPENVNDKMIELCASSSANSFLACGGQSETGGREWAKV